MAVAETQKPSEDSKTTNQPNTITLRIARSNPSEGQEASFAEFQIPIQKWTTVLEAILYVKQHFDHSVAVRYSCRQASCGSCGMKINGKPALACYTKISELNSNVITVEPMNNFPIIRDLAVDFKQLISNHKKIKPFIIREDSEITPGSKEFIQKPEDLEKFLQFSYCIKCGLCNSACPTMATDTSFIGPQGLAQAYRYVADNRDKGKDDRLKVIDDSHGIWRCHFAGSCSHVCPKGVDPAMAIQLLRGYLLGFRK
ncbi:fumarate reductase (anaerobic), Fe-S subunit [Nitrosotalea sinensis]|jgi:succinate dehydrogenase / fumarate reductase iron-sulfur subunit|uniref:succinate dehydrogenase n=1 Tax=Nitrosotalea sinensis TaxID=1499975 RepID=A0A2H1EFZ5_9ARCH|nr:succinate dehydrogenase iron-sulfur subunit [Candidatus Nitrosotalea sinensis]SHO44385.1 fumarate reductase (anaerobic), Fe-S subunit [Candidatus Nitrosotalea sinensis]